MMWQKTKTGADTVPQGFPHANATLLKVEFHKWLTQGAGFIGSCGF